MQTQFASSVRAHPSAARADEILRRCVHCGLCNATCPTYQLLGDELDGPRGRIYLIKALLEKPGADTAGVAQTHLDRCLTCRACETTCPSGVAYGELLELGREAADAQQPRTPWRGLGGAVRQAGALRAGVLRLRRLWDWLLRSWLGMVAPSVRWFPRWAALGRLLRWALPGPLAAALPPRPGTGVLRNFRFRFPPGRRLLRWVLPGRLFTALCPGSAAAAEKRVQPPLSPGRRFAGVGDPQAGPSPPSGAAARQALLLQGCVQRQATPAVHGAAVRYFNGKGVRTVVAPREGCCGALNLHLGQTDQARQAMRRNLDALAPYVQQASWLVSTASGCGVTVKDYGRLLADDAEYAALAAKVASKTRDLAEVASELGVSQPSNGRNGAVRKVAWHPPCTLQHGQRITGLVERLLADAGYQLTLVRDAHLCCGSAGAYSILQPQLAQRLKADKLANLAAGGPDVIATANVGCQMHLQAAADRPVMHWIELLAG